MYDREVETTVNLADRSLVVPNASSFDACTCRGETKVPREHRGYVRLEHTMTKDDLIKYQEARGEETCMLCPDGAICRQGNNTIARLSSKASPGT